MIKFILPLLINVSANATLKVAIIDTGYDFHSTWPDIESKGFLKPKMCKTGHKDFVQPKNIVITDLNPPKIQRVVPNDQYLVDNHGHGTQMAGLIAKYAGNSDYCIIVLKFYDPIKPSNNVINMNQAIHYATKLGVDIINISGGGVTWDEDEYKATLNALNRGITIVAAAGNEKSNIDYLKYYPAMYDSRIIAVENWMYKIDKSTNKLVVRKAPSTNYSELGSTDGYEVGTDIESLAPHNTYQINSGTSQATAIRTGKLIKHFTTVKKLNKNYMLERIKRMQNVA